jgi:hypothetical protein
MTHDPETLVSLYLHDPESMTEQDIDGLSAWIKQDPSHAAQFAHAAKPLRLCLDGEVVASGTTAVLPKDLGKTTQNWLGRSQWTADAYFACVKALSSYRRHEKFCRYSSFRLTPSASAQFT